MKYVSPRFQHRVLKQQQLDKTFFSFDSALTSMQIVITLIHSCTSKLIDGWKWEMQIFGPVSCTRQSKTKIAKNKNNNNWFSTASNKLTHNYMHIQSEKKKQGTKTHSSIYIYSTFYRLLGSASLCTRTWAWARARRLKHGHINFKIQRKQ